MEETLKERLEKSYGRKLTIAEIISIGMGAYLDKKTTEEAIEEAIKKKEEENRAEIEASRQHYQKNKHSEIVCAIITELEKKEIIKPLLERTGAEWFKGFWMGDDPNDNIIRCLNRLARQIDSEVRAEYNAGLIP